MDGIQREEIRDVGIYGLNHALINMFHKRPLNQTSILLEKMNSKGWFFRTFWEKKCFEGERKRNNTSRKGTRSEVPAGIFVNSVRLRPKRKFLRYLRAIVLFFSLLASRLSQTPISVINSETKDKKNKKQVQERRKEGRNNHELSTGKFVFAIEF
mmetsp:Transcript_33332/g.37864  ORF Transcript_33332/g.37864 Transcript_33332/m.37864 type:complete len:155 (+) Transcript_33332:299-763(+)